MVVFDDETAVAHAAVVPRTIQVVDRSVSTGYVEAVATHPMRRRKGLGAMVMTEVADLLHSHFEMGALSTGRQDFYRRLGWERWQGPTYVRVGSELIRTVEEDEGVMVLRFGPSRGVDLTAPISCEGRPGDDW